VRLFAPCLSGVRVAKATHWLPVDIGRQPVLLGVSVCVLVPFAASVLVCRSLSGVSVCVTGSSVPLFVFGFDSLRRCWGCACLRRPFLRLIRRCVGSVRLVGARAVPFVVGVWGSRFSGKPPPVSPACLHISQRFR